MFEFISKNNLEIIDQALEVLVVRSYNFPNGSDHGRDRVIKLREQYHRIQSHLKYISSQLFEGDKPEYSCYCLQCGVSANIVKQASVFGFAYCASCDWSGYISNI